MGFQAVLHGSGTELGPVPGRPPRTGDGPHPARYWGSRPTLSRVFLRQRRAFLRRVRLWQAGLTGLVCHCLVCVAERSCQGAAFSFRGKEQEDSGLRYRRASQSARLLTATLRREEDLLWRALRSPLMHVQGVGALSLEIGRAHV